MKIITTTIQKQVLAVLMGAMICFGIAFTTLPMKAEAQTAPSMTVEQMLAQIQQLMAIIASLQAQIEARNTTLTVPSVCPYAWTRPLAIGDTGRDVMKLQQFLNTSADTRIAVTGDGAPGFETTYYGQATADAVSAFQVKYRSEILSPVGYVNPNGFFGPLSMAKANQLCATAPGVPTPPDTAEEYDGVILDVYPDEETIGTGEDDRGVLSAEISADDQHTITDLYINFENESGSNTVAPYPWHSFDNISVWVNGDRYAELQTYSLEDDWTEYGQGDPGAFMFHMSDMNINVPADGSEISLIVAVSVTEDAQLHEWDFSIANMTFSRNGGSDITFGNPVQIPVAVVDGNPAAYLEVSASPDSPDASTILVEAGNESDQYTVQIVTISETAGVDVEIDTVSFETGIGGTSAGADVVIDSAILEYDGDQVEIAVPSSGFLVFEDLGLYLDANSEVDLELQMIFEAQEDYGNGVIVQSFFNSIDSAEDANSNVLTYENMGTTYVSGEIHTLMASGAIVELITSDTEASSDNMAATFEFTFEVTAVGNDVYIPNRAGTENTGTGFFFRNAETGSMSGSLSFLVDTTADEDGGEYVVSEGDTETFTIIVDFTPTYTGVYSLEMYELRYRIGNNSSIETNSLSGFESPAAELLSASDYPLDLQPEEPPEPPEAPEAIDDTAVSPVELGTYMGYMDGSRFIATENISSDDAYDNCVLNAEQNPTRDVYCTWNGSIIYSVEGQTPVEEVEEDDGSYGISDVDKITRRDYYDGVKSRDTLSHRNFRILLKDGTIHRVRRDAGMSTEAFNAAVRATGYTGTMSDFHDKKQILSPRVLGASISVDPMSQLSNALYAIEDIVAELQARIK